MSTINDPMHDALTSANAQSANQIEEALKLLTSALQTLKGATENDTSDSSKSEENQATATNSPIMSALHASNTGAQEAMKAAENGVKAAIANAEKHIQTAMKSFPQNAPSQNNTEPKK